MIARLGTVGRLGRGVYGYAQDLNPSLSPTFRTVPEAERQMLTLLTMLRLMLTFRLLEYPMFTRVVNVVNVQKAVFQGASGERKTQEKFGKQKAEMGKWDRQKRSRSALSHFCFLLSTLPVWDALGRLWDGLGTARKSHNRQ